jgi:diguanylate cyclase (GGDEF)-like protein/PAS domain S-box-containing protein
MNFLVGKTELFEQIYNGISEGIMITDRDGIIISINSALESLSGYKAYEIIGKKTSVFKSGEQSHRFYKNMWIELKANCQWKGSLRNRKKNGDIFVVYLSVFSIFDKTKNVPYYVSIISDITEKQNTKEQLEYLSYHDDLTGLFNRIMLQKKMEEAIGNPKESGGYTALLILDFDRFKVINETYGHEFGDELLIKIAKELRSALRLSDTIARLGGDEFGCLLYHIHHQEEALIIAQKLLKVVMQPWKLSNNETAYLKTSIGIAFFPLHAQSTSMFLKAADIALYDAKRKGHGKISIYHPTMEDGILQFVEYENGLRRALEYDTFFLHYQPQVNIKTGEIRSVEALIRWNDPKLGSVPPNIFIPIAEQMGLINEIGEWVLNQACQQVKRWEVEEIQLRVAVNVSMKQFENNNLKKSVCNAITAMGISPSNLELEFTEGVVMNHLDQTLETMLFFKSYGLILSIDDFGTGYSSLSYLKKLPVHILKIDKSFVDGLPKDKEDAQIASSIIALGHIMGFEILAEGVETQDQLDFLISQGCDTYQGYLKSKPVPAEQISILISSNRNKIAKV